ncbi:Hypothetical protein FKW44_019342, partial [Caligus rogercresseyi]
IIIIEDIRAIMISTAARYLAFTVKIPTINTIPWKYVGIWYNYIRLLRWTSPISTTDYE